MTTKRLLRRYVLAVTATCLLVALHLSCTQIPLEPIPSPWILDSRAPVLTIAGDDTMYLAPGESFVDPGASAVDNLDGDLSDRILRFRRLDADSTGTIQVIYMVFDRAGNADSAYRYLAFSSDPLPPTNTTFVDTVAPVLSLVGSPYVTLLQFTSFVDSGAYAIDASDGDLTDQLFVAGTVDTSTVGVYHLTYRVADSFGNEVAVDRIVEVVPATGPQDLLLEAEEAFVTEAAAVITDTMEDGGAYVQFGAGVVSAAGWTAVVPSDGVYRFVLRYAVESDRRDSLRLTVSTSTIDTALTLFGSRNQPAWDYLMLGQIPLYQGLASLQITTAGSGTLLLDKLYLIQE